MDWFKCRTAHRNYPFVRFLSNSNAQKTLRKKISMKKNLLILIGLIILSLLGYYLLKQNNSRNTLSDLEAEYSFTIEDTASIDRIVISDKSPRKVDMQKVDGIWQLNGKKIRKDVIEVLLETFRRMEMRNFVEEMAKEEVIRRMATYAKEVVIYSNGKETKHFFVGTDTPDQMATYMMMDGGSQAYAVHIPGFNGYLSSRFITVEELLFDRTLFPITSNEIRLFSLNYSSVPENSFEIQVDGDKASLKRLKEGSWKDVASDPKFLELYLKQIVKLNYEGAIVESDPIYARKDSLLAVTPMMEFKLESTSGESFNLKAYQIKSAENEVDALGNPREFDPDRLHGILSDGRMVLLQYFGLRDALLVADQLTSNIE